MAFRGDWLSHLSKLCKLTILSVDSIKPLTTCGHSTKADLIQGGERKRKESFIPKDFHMSVKNVRKMLKFIVFHKGFIFWYLEFSVHDLNTQCCLLLCYKTITRANIFTKVVTEQANFPRKSLNSRRAHSKKYSLLFFNAKYLFYSKAPIAFVVQRRSKSRMFPKIYS